MLQSLLVTACGVQWQDVTVVCAIVRCASVACEIVGVLNWSWLAQPGYFKSKTIEKTFSNNMSSKTAWRYYCNKRLLLHSCYSCNNGLIAVINLAIAVIKRWKCLRKLIFPLKTYGVITVTSPSNKPFIIGVLASPGRGLLLRVAPWAQGPSQPWRQYHSRGCLEDNLRGKPPYDTRPHTGR